MSIAIWFVDRLHSSGTMISMAAVHYVMAFVIYRRVSEISSFVTIACVEAALCKLYFHTQQWIFSTILQSQGDQRDSQVDIYL